MKQTFKKSISAGKKYFGPTGKTEISDISRNSGRNCEPWLHPLVGCIPWCRIRGWPLEGLKLDVLLTMARRARLGALRRPSLTRRSRRRGLAVVWRSPATAASM